jgi:ribosome biogenesis GTPase / thiamine phosphate phosphatase
MLGKVVRSTGSWYSLIDENKNRVECRIKGKFRIQGIRTTNPVAVGDQVEFVLEEDQATGIITKVFPRNNYIIRKSIQLNKEAQILGSNLDQTLLLITLIQPRTSLGFIDRFTVSAESFHIPIILGFNKFELYPPEALDTLREIEAIYQKIGYQCIEFSVVANHNMEGLEELIQGKTTLISGHSGVGKSTLINYLIPTIKLKTQEVSASSDRGLHTTTFAEMFELPSGGNIIDTPGIRELGVIGVEKEELAHFFPEMKARMKDCRFHNCRHIGEPGCAVLKALKQGEIEPSRYDSYQSLYFNQETRG